MNGDFDFGRHAASGLKAVNDARELKEYRLVYDDAPKSVNAGGGGSRKNKYAAHREKRMWEGIFGMLLMSERVPKPLGFTRITIELEFKAARMRDSTNYYHPVVKPLLDAMKLGGWIKDDTDDYVQIERLYLVEHGDRSEDAPRFARSGARTTITLQVAG